MIPNPMLILAIVLAFVANGFYWNAKGSNAADTRWEAKIEKQRADAEAAARTKESMWQGVVNGTVKNYEVKVAGIQRNLDLALDSLRSRPGRGSSDVPGATGPACPCGTGATLCREDGEFLAREAARADKHREALAACYQVIDGTK
jgi:hypothetical protein